jgi:hypothetical protein
MSVITIEGVVENGQIRLNTNLRLPEKAKVYVVIPDMPVEQTHVVQVISPHLVHPEDVTDFRMDVIEESPDASV